ncbi:uncharacterized protein [Clytia hemisphaerica]
MNNSLLQENNKNHNTMASIGCTLLTHLLIFLLWCILLPLIVVLLPFVVLAIIIRGTEALVYYCKYKCTPIRSTDLLWTFETPGNRMIISGMLQLDGKVYLETFRTSIRERLIEKKNEDGDLIYPQAQQYLEAGYVNYYWKNIGKININDHVYNLCQEPVKSETELQSLISEHSGKKFPNDNQRSPWEMVLVPYLTENSQVEKTVVVFRLKHAIADGSALAYFLINQLADNGNQTGTMIKKFTQRQRILLNIKALWYLPLVYAKIMLHPKEKNVLYTKELTGIKKQAWSKPIDLETVKRAKNRMNGTVNDVLVGCLSKAMGSYFQDCRQLSTKQNLTTIFAVDTRSSISEAQYFRNYVAGIVVKLPMYTETVEQSIQLSKAIFDRVKEIGEPISTYMGWHFLSFLLPAAVSKFFVFDQVGKTTASISNLMGPQYKVTINGHDVEMFAFWPPGTYTQSLSVSFCSYNEQIRMGIEVDTSVLQDPAPILNLFEEAVKNI